MTPPRALKEEDKVKRQKKGGGEREGRGDERYLTKQVWSVSGLQPGIRPSLHLQLGDKPQIIQVSLPFPLSLSHTNQELEYSTCQTPRLWTCSGRASKDASDRGV